MSESWIFQPWVEWVVYDHKTYGYGVVLGQDSHLPDGDSAWYELKCLVESPIVKLHLRELTAHGVHATSHTVYEVKGKERHRFTYAPCLYTYCKHCTRIIVVSHGIIHKGQGQAGIGHYIDPQHLEDKESETYELMSEAEKSRIMYASFQSKM